MENNILEINKKFDDKVTIFQQEIEKDFSKKCDISAKKCDNRFHEAKSVIGKFKVDVQSQINDFKETPMENINLLRSELRSIGNEANKFDFTGLAEAFTKERESNEYLISKINDKIDSIHKHVVKHEQSLKNLQKSTSSFTSRPTNNEIRATYSDKVKSHSSEESVNSNIRRVNTSSFNQQSDGDIIMCMDSNRNS